jgi:uncharacterized ubiquitin-like protein YukD
MAHGDTEQRDSAEAKQLLLGDTDTDLGSCRFFSQTNPHDGKYYPFCRIPMHDNRPLYEYFGIQRGEYPIRLCVEPRIQPECIALTIRTSIPECWIAVYAKTSDTVAQAKEQIQRQYPDLGISDLHLFKQERELNDQESLHDCGITSEDMELRLQVIPTIDQWEVELILHENIRMTVRVNSNTKFADFLTYLPQIAKTESKHRHPRYRSRYPIYDRTGVWKFFHNGRKATVDDKLEAYMTKEQVVLTGNRFIYCTMWGYGQHIYIKTLYSQQYTLQISDMLTIGALRLIVWQVAGVIPAWQRLIFAAKQLTEDNKTIRDYNISRECTIHLVTW